MDRQTHWQTVYVNRAETAVSWFQERPETSLRLIDGRMPASGRIVDVGGGASRLVDGLLARGHDVCVVDLAEAALDQARRRLGPQAARVDWVVGDITRWRPERPFDLWHDRAVFHFLIEERERRAYAEVMAAAVVPGGHAVIGTFAWDGPEKCSGLPVRRYDRDSLAGEFAGDFVLVEALREDHRTPGGGVQPFQYVVLRRA